MSQQLKLTAGEKWGYSIFLIAFGIANLVFAIYEYNEFVMLERTGGEKQIPWLFAMIYRVTGKWGVLAVISGLSYLSFQEAIKVIRTKPIFQKPSTESNFNGSTRAGTHGNQFVSSAPMILCKKFIIEKSRRLQTSETTGMVLASQDAIYFAKDRGFGSQVAIGEFLGGVIAGAAAEAEERLIIGQLLKAAGAIPFDRLPSEVQAYFARLGCSGDVVVLPRSAVKEVSASLWTGINLKTDTHLFELRVGPLEFSKVRKKLSFYKWL